MGLQEIEALLAVLPNQRRVAAPRTCCSRAPTSARCKSRLDIRTWVRDELHPCPAGVNCCPSDALAPHLQLGWV